MAKIWQRVTLLSQWKLGIALPWVTWTVTITLKRERRYIYIHHAQCKHTEHESKCLHP